MAEVDMALFSYLFSPPISAPIRMPPIAYLLANPNSVPHQIIGTSAPSICTMAPVMSLARSDARNTTAFATSFGSAKRPSASLLVSNLNLMLNAQEKRPLRKTLRGKALIPEGVVLIF
jgi:hypothetical protein